MEKIEKNYFFTQKLPKEYEIMFKDITRKAEGQKKALLVKIKEYVDKDEQYSLIEGMIEILLFHETRKTRAETYLQSIREIEKESEKAKEQVEDAMKRLTISVAKQEKMKLDVLLNITGN